MRWILEKQHTKPKDDKEEEEEDVETTRQAPAG